MSPDLQELVTWLEEMHEDAKRQAREDRKQFYNSFGSGFSDGKEWTLSEVLAKAKEIDND